MHANNPSRHCLAAHLYYSEPWEPFLTEALAPFVEEMLKSKQIWQYFFIRYKERGPHIRLRLKTEGPVGPLKESLQAHFSAYFARNPSFRTQPEDSARSPNSKEWLPNNSVQFEPYLPETERYGGVAGLELAEQHFAISSHIVLAYLKKQPSQPAYEHTMGFAIQLQLSFVYLMGMDRPTAILFFQFICHNWLPHSLEASLSDGELADFEQQRTNSLRAFAIAFEQQKDLLIASHTSIWQALEEGTAFEDELLNVWIVENSQLAAQLAEMVTAQAFELRPTNQRYSFLPAYLDSPTAEQWMYFADLLHMTNNRLGILNRDESFLAYLMWNSLEAIAKNK